MTSLEGRIHEFLAENPEIDEKAQNDLKDCPPEVQEAVLARGEIGSARNKSAALIARIRDARKFEGITVTNEEVEKFLADNEIEDSAADELRNSPKHVQATAIQRGALTGCRNKSGALIARIRDAKRGGDAWGGGGWGGKGGWWPADPWSMGMMMGGKGKGKDGGKGKWGGGWGPY
eukprot:TRINITY_DN75241_c0_g1_i1.p2 TRINITY_DN75241_c0_g1~~TRINITY_DN75241_c0_g1_i1.p2  ORF type:complete len:176 (-),score=48.15 TRINITY_DN75241_c0_g1_i1:130-657(-)